ncbi:hypothetical protein ACVWWO_005672 [Bradyrhizobium sp. F1.13.1]
MRGTTRSTARSPTTAAPWSSIPVSPISSTRGASSGLRKGDKPKAVQDFGAALKIDPNHEQAKANHKAMAREIERIGAQMAVAGKPSFICKGARRPVERAICANRELADLDREVFAANARVLREARNAGEAKALQREQDDFIARRNAGFGRPGYDLKKAMQERLQRLNGVDGY